MKAIFYYLVIFFGCKIILALSRNIFEHYAEIEIRTQNLLMNVFDFSTNATELEKLEKVSSQLRYARDMHFNQTKYIFLEGNCLSVVEKFSLFITNSGLDKSYHARLILLNKNHTFSLIYDVLRDQINLAYSFQLKNKHKFILDNCPNGFIGGPQPQRALQSLFGTSFLINTYTSGNQSNPKVALLGGGFMVIWTSFNGLTMKNVFMQSITGIDAKRGVETPVNTIYLFQKEFPNIASISVGGYSITWLCPGYLRNSIFNSDDTVKTSAYTVGCCGGDQQSMISLIAGELVFVMQRATDSYITAQINDGSGGTLVAEYNVWVQVGQDPSCSPTLTGGFVVSFVCRCDSDNSLGVYLTIYTSRGAVIISNVMVHTVFAGDQIHSQVVTLKFGGFVVIWISNGQNPSTYAIYGQRFFDNATKIGVEFKINDLNLPNDINLYPDLNSLSDGGFIVTWEYLNPNGNRNIHGNLFDNNGTKRGTEFSISQNGIYDHRNSSVSVDVSSVVLVVWMSYGEAGSEYGIYGQIVQIFLGMQNCQISIKQGKTINLSSTMISANGNDSVVLKFLVSNTVNCQFEFTSNPGVAITTFSQTQINLGQVNFVQNGSINAPQFSIQATDNR